MSDQASVVAYLTPASFWRWVDQGRSVAWSSAETIAFRQELSAVMNRLSAVELPPFTSIVLLLAATRDEWYDASHHLLIYTRDLCLPGGGDPTGAQGVIIRAVGHRLEGDTTMLVESLHRVAALPRELRHSLAAKAALAELVFSKCPPANSDMCAQVVAELQSASDPGTFEPRRAQSTAVRDLVDTIEALSKGLEEVDAERLRLRMRTGLDGLIQSPKEELGLSQRMHQLLGEMGDDLQLGGLSRIARRLLPAVQVPRLLHRHEPMPAGGVADISNRGQLDRLLLSELAHDDLVLAVRVAVNEALYLQRESPPHRPPQKRVILLDTGIRTWGVPRIYATAVAMALIATGEDHSEAAMYRPSGKEIVPIDLTTLEGLLSHLESLEPAPHFGRALPAFAGVLSPECESFLITQEQVLDDPDFRNELNKLERFTVYAATVARDGTFRLWTLNSTGRSLLRQAVLNLDELLIPNTKPTPQPLIETPSELPIILSVQPFPLCLPATAGAIERVATSSNGDKVAMTRDRQLMVWRNDSCGGRTLWDRLPIGRLHLLQFTSDDTTIVAVFSIYPLKRSGKTVVCVMDLQQGKPVQTKLSGIDYIPIGIILQQDKILVIGPKKVVAYGLHSAEPEATVESTGRFWLRGRVFRGGSVTSLLCVTAAGLSFETVPTPLGETSQIFELRGAEGLMYMTSKGVVRSSATPGAQVREGIGDAVQFVAVTADGRGIVAKTSGAKQQHFYLDLSLNSAWRKVSGPLSDLLNSTTPSDLAPLHASHQLRRQFSGVFADRDGRLILQCKSGLLEMKRSGTDLRLVRATNVSQISQNGLRPFARLSSTGGAGYRLKAAAWNGKNQVFLDSRGLLHLKSINPSVPEITIVLNDNGPLGGWSSDGRFYGPMFFHGSNSWHSGSHLEELIRRFVENLQ